MSNLPKISIRHFSVLMSLISIVLVNAIAAVSLRASDQEKVFAIFEKHCVVCHNSDEPKGGLSLGSHADFLKGGDSGDVASLKKIEESYLLEVISGDEPEMPQDAAPLSKDDIESIKSWLESGAPWPGDKKLTDKSLADLEWWSLKPIAQPKVPAVLKSKRVRIQNPIDAFVASKLLEKNLSMSPPAEKRVLIRRLYFDLIGLPPTPKEIKDFVTDTNPNAYDQLVETLLEDKRYGERWARHWLDVVHYGDTHGYDKDKLRPNAWPYRDYVIRSLNQDKPYKQFVLEQLAGDQLFPNSRDGIEALGFISAGPWDFIGHAEVPETKIDGRVARHLDRDDMVSTTMNAFCSITVQCAQCHNHKFDPVTQENYYDLQSVFAALDRADRRYDRNPKTKKIRNELTVAIAALETRLSSVLAEMRDESRYPEVAKVESEIVKLTQLLEKEKSPQRPEFGYHSGIAPKQNTTKWVAVDLGKPKLIDKIILVACNDDFAGIGEGFGFPVQFKIEASNDPAFKKDFEVIADQTQNDFENPKCKPQSFHFKSEKEYRYVRVVASKLAPRQNDFIFALSELMVLAKDGKNIGSLKKVFSLDSIEAPVRWRRANLVDGIYPNQSSQNSAVRIAELTRKKRKLIEELVDPKLRKLQTDLQTDLKLKTDQLKSLPPQSLVYAGTIHTGSGAFVGRGHVNGKPREVRLLHRGNITSPGKVSVPGTIPVIKNAPTKFELPENHAEGDRRVALANWIVRKDNPLVWRSIVNRVWQYHFGRGIVDSPNDFGRMGQLPTHPELLDWLAIEFRDGGGSLKDLHRMIVKSAAFQQSSADNLEMSKVDRSNRFLWRMNRRKIESEIVWDTVLYLSGKLRNEMGGPGFRNFVLEKPEHSPHYEYEKYDVDDVKTHRRSIYRFVVRSAPDPLMECLDCADPSLLVDKRNQTVTPLQALSMMNNQFVVRMSEHFADRFDAKDPNRVAKAFHEAIGRAPSRWELEKLQQYAKQNGMANYCRLLFNLNEFLFVD